MDPPVVGQVQNGFFIYYHLNKQKILQLLQATGFIDEQVYFSIFITS